jgi:hypothetical protein
VAFGACSAAGYTPSDPYRFPESALYASSVLPSALAPAETSRFVHAETGETRAATRATATGADGGIVDARDVPRRIVRVDECESRRRAKLTSSLGGSDEFFFSTRAHDVE